MKGLLILIIALALTLAFGACKKKEPPVPTATTAATACSANCEPGDSVCPECKDDPNCNLKKQPATPPAPTPPGTGGTSCPPSG